MSDTMPAGSPEQAHREKGQAAAASVVAAVFLTFFKVIVGVMTGSLGILAEAAHSALDLVAAVVTLFAVRVSSRPADRTHTYGHGKVENLSALFETVLLLATCAWIIYEAVQRLFFKSVEVEPGVWAFAIMLIAIVVDVNRSRMLYRVAKQYDSQALEADALHFSTDIWSSAVVVVGLFLVVVAQRLGIPWLAKADALAAVGVALIVVWVSLKLGARTVMALLDGVPASVRDEVLHAVRVPGVVEVRQVRLRRSGPEAFADVRLSVARHESFERTHDIAAAAQRAVQAVLPGADVVVQVEPVRADHEGWLSTVRVLADRHGMSAHGIRIYDLGAAGHSVELHLEVSEGLSLEGAHTQATAFEQALREAIPGVSEVITHLEPVGDAFAHRAATPADTESIRRIVESISGEAGARCRPHDVTVRDADGELQVTFHCLLPAGTPIAEAHSLTEHIESRLRRRVPDLGRVVIHVEPEEDLVREPAPSAAAHSG